MYRQSPKFSSVTKTKTLVEIVIFSVDAAKNLKKQEICIKFQQKTGFF